MYITNSVAYYDSLYVAHGKDYGKEVEYLVEAIRASIKGKRPRLLDVACGTGSHLLYLRKYFDVEGVDISLDFVRMARTKLPKTIFYVGDMRTFRTGKEYQIVTCLFSSIGFMETPTKLCAAIRNMAKHVAPGGMLLVEPWFSPGEITSGRVLMSIVDEDKLKIVRMSTAKVDGNISSFDFHYLVGTSKGTEHFVERHKLGLYSKDEMIEVFEKGGLSVTYDAKGPTGKGLFLGKKR